MRALLILTALLAASGARSQTAPLAERIVGDWANTDSVAHAIYDEHGDEIVGTDGGPAFVTLTLHLAITDSVITSTAVSRSEGELRGSESTTAYSLRGDSLYSNDDIPVGVDVRNDSLVISRTDSLGTRTDYAYARAAPLHPPEALLGDWITGERTDAAGVVFDLPFRFHADGTVVVGYSEPLAYRVVGPYLLQYDMEFTDPASGALTTLYRVSSMDLQEGRLTLSTPGEEPLILYRR